MKWFWAPVAALILALSASLATAAVPVWGVSVVHVYPHDRNAFTEGLFYLDGYLYESTGLNGQSSVRKVDLATMYNKDRYRPNYSDKMSLPIFLTRPD